MSRDRTVETVLEFGEPDAIILEYVEENDVDRIVMGSDPGDRIEWRLPRRNEITDRPAGTPRRCVGAS